MLPGEFLTHVIIKNLMLASTLMWTSSAPMMLLILGVSGTWTIGAQVRTSPCWKHNKGSILLLTRVVVPKSTVDSLLLPPCVRLQKKNATLCEPKSNTDTDPVFATALGLTPAVHTNPSHPPIPSAAAACEVLASLATICRFQTNFQEYVTIENDRATSKGPSRGASRGRQHHQRPEYVPYHVVDFTLQSKKANRAASGTPDQNSHARAGQMSLKCDRSNPTASANPAANPTTTPTSNSTADPAHRGPAAPAPALSLFGHQKTQTKAAYTRRIS